MKRGEAIGDYWFKLFAEGYSTAMFWEHHTHKYYKAIILLISFCYFWGINIFLWVPAIINVFKSNYSIFEGFGYNQVYSSNNHFVLVFLALFCILPPFHWRVLGQNVALFSRFWRKITGFLNLESDEDKLERKEKLQNLYDNYFDPNDKGIMKFLNLSNFAKYYWICVVLSNLVMLILIVLGIYDLFNKKTPNKDLIDTLALPGLFVALLLFIASMSVASSAVRIGIGKGKIRKIFLFFANIPLSLIVGLIIYGIIKEITS